MGVDLFAFELRRVWRSTQRRNQRERTTSKKWQMAVFIWYSGKPERRILRADTTSIYCLCHDASKAVLRSDRRLEYRERLAPTESGYCRRASWSVSFRICLRLLWSSNTLLTWSDNSATRVSGELLLLVSQCPLPPQAVKCWEPWQPHSGAYSHSLCCPQQQVQEATVNRHICSVISFSVRVRR